MKDKDLLKLLLKNGWKDVRQRGSHHRLKKDNQVEVIAVHGKDVPTGLLNAILRRTGLKYRGSRNTVKHAERPIHEPSVYKPSLPHCRCHRLENPAEKAERKEQPQSLKSCIPHILYLSSPDFSFVFPEALPHLCICSQNTVLRFFIPLFSILLL